MDTRLAASPLVLALACGWAIAGDPTKQPNYDNGVTNIRTLKKEAGLTGEGARLGMIEQGIPVTPGSVNKNNAVHHLAMLNRVGVTGPLEIAPAKVGGAYAISARRHAHAVAGIMIANDTDKNGKNNSIGIAHKANLRAESAFLHPDNATKPSDQPIKALRKAVNALLQKDPPSVLNMSWGFGIVQLPKDNPEGVRVIADWLASSNEMLVVSAVGNKAKSVHGYLTPSDGFNVLTVSATGAKSTLMKYDVMLEDMLTGKTPDGRAKPDLMAPGSVIYTTNAIHAAKVKDENGNEVSVWTGWTDEFPKRDGTGNTKISGSSFAAPHVSGIAGLLIEAAGKHGWADADVKAARDRRTLRAVLINGTHKQVRVAEKGQTWMDRADARGDKQPLDYELGAGMVDALRSHNILVAGPQPRANAGNIGWARESTEAKVNAVAAYKIKDKVRMGTYISATLAWERPTGGKNVEDAAYTDTLANLDLEVFASNTDRRSSTSRVDSVEHVYHKTTSEGPFEIRVVNRSDKAVPFAVAWHSERLPDKPKELNGRFDGDRREPADHGWYTPVESSLARMERRDWMPGDDWDMAACFTPEAGSFAAIAQQTPRPQSGMRVTFDAAFSTHDDPTAILRVFLGPIDLTALAGYPGGIVPDDLSVESFSRIKLEISDGSVFAGLEETTDLRFEFASLLGAEAYVDNVEYGPIE